MIIVLDTRWMTGSPSGIGVYIREMLARLPLLAPDLSFHALFRSDEDLRAGLALAKAAGLPNVSASVVPCGPFSPKSQILLPRVLRSLRCDLFHTPNYIMPYMGFGGGNGARRPVCVANIHDVIPLAVPGYAPKSKTSRLRAVYKALLRASVRRASVITGSEASKRDMVAALRLSEAEAARISVILDGAGDRLSAEGRVPVKEASDPAPRTFLYVGRMDPYKNVPLLVEMLDLVRKEVPYPVRLRIVGPRDPRYPDAELRAAELGLSDSVEFSGFVTDAQLADAYRTADLLTHPSRYEGFGLQIVEAMRSGLPVVCTDGGSQPEVAGGAAVVVPRDDARAMASAVVALLNDPARQRDLQRRGLVRAGEVTWDATAAATLALYRSLLEK